MLKIALMLLMLTSTAIMTAQYKVPSKMDWWYEARFGMFIHFGSYIYLGHGEWAYFTDTNPIWTKSTYQAQVSAKFNPTNFNAGTIARLAKNSGMKYLVITAKHHEGFCIWKTAVQSFKDVTGTTIFDLPDFTNFKARDILMELKDSCDAIGIKFCLYYSIMDWNHSSQEVNRTTYYSTMASMTARTNYLTDMKAQLSELVTKYHPAILWFDGDWDGNVTPQTLNDWRNERDGQDLYKYMIGLDSNIIVNERVKRDFGLGDYAVAENGVPLTPMNRQWETCNTMNNSWGYNATDLSFKTTDSLIHEMVRVVSRDGNYLLNIGPKGDGTVPDQSASILNSFGNWMDKYSQSIYGTTRSPFSSEPKWGVYTKKDGKLYAHIFWWPTNGLLEVPSLANTINSVYLLNDTSTSLTYSDSSGYIRVSIPVNAPDPINSVLVIDMSGVPSAYSGQINKVAVLKNETGIFLFPNPTRDGILNIKQTENTALDIAIYNLSGQLLISRKMNREDITLDTSALSPGVYSVKASNGEKVMIQKFIRD